MKDVRGSMRIVTDKFYCCSCIPVYTRGRASNQALVAMIEYLSNHSYIDIATVFSVFCYSTKLSL